MIDKKNTEPQLYYSEPGFKIGTYNKKIYELTELTKQGALNMPGTTEDILESGVMGINENSIIYHNIPKIYLKYTIIQESLCPDMINGFNIESIEEEMKVIPNNIYNDYLEWRVDFYEGMVNYWSKLNEENLKKNGLNKEEKGKYIINLNKILKYLKSLENTK